MNQDSRINLLSLDQAAESLLQGDVGVIPTDTLYGIVARAADEQAVERMYRLKHREHKPGTLIAANEDQLLELGLSADYLKIVTKYWPGAVSVIIPCGPELSYLHQEKFGLAVRIPNDPIVCEFLEKTGPLITSSANLPGEPTANGVDEAHDYFGDQADFYVDGGNRTDFQPSTLIRINGDGLELLRQGAVVIPPEELTSMTKNQ